MAAKHFILAATAVALVCGNAYPAVAATAGGQVTAARNFIRASLMDGDLDDAYFLWPDKDGNNPYTANAPITGVSFTSANVTFITEGSEFEFPLKNLKISVGRDDMLHWGGPMELRISSNPSHLLPAGRATKGEFLIGLPASVSSAMANKIVADFAILGRAVPSMLQNSN